MNQLTIIGNMVEKPVIRYTEKGIAQATFRLGVNRRYQSNGEWKQEATFFTCVTWAELAEAVTANFEKGDRAIVVGRMASRSYEDAKGDKRTVWELAAEDVGVSVKPAKTAGRGTRPETPEEPF